MIALLSLLPGWWRYAAVAILALSCMAFGSYKMRTHDNVRYGALAAEFSTFKAQVAAAGEQAKKAAADRELADHQRKEKADHENATTVAALNDRIKRLRESADARGSIVPAAPASASRPDLACFERAELERALGIFLGEARGLADEGSAATVDLDTAKKWGQAGSAQP